MGRSIDQKVKEKVLDAIIQRKLSVRDAAKEFKVAPPTIYVWLAKVQKASDQKLAGEEREDQGESPVGKKAELYKRIGLLELEVRTLREFMALHGLKPPKFER